MAFMALFGWIFLPLIPIVLFLMAAQSVLLWVTSHTFLVNVIAAVLLALNLLVLVLLLRARVRRKRAGVKRFRWLLLLAALWEGWVVFLCALWLVVQPLRFLPAGFGETFSLENNCYGVWTVTACQGTTPGCTQSQEEIDALIGQQVAYQAERFCSTRWAYPLRSEDDYQVSMTRKESFPPLYAMSQESLGIDKGSLRHIKITLSDGMDRDDPLGQDFYILDKNTLLIYRKGVFFRAERTDGPFPERTDRPMIRDPQAAPYVARWMVTACLGTVPEDPMEPELIEKIVGTQLDYQDGYIRFTQDSVGGGRVGDPVYREMELTQEEFQSVYGVSLEELGIEPEVYRCVTLEVDDSISLEGLKVFFQGLGRHFLLLDEETLLLCGKGAFFRAEIVPDSWPMIPDPNY